MVKVCDHGPGACVAYDPTYWPSCPYCRAEKQRHKARMQVHELTDQIEAKDKEMALLKGIKECRENYE